MSKKYTGERFLVEDKIKLIEEYCEQSNQEINGKTIYKGYPIGISGEDIPLLARILCVADSFDAITSKRCYKDATGLERAFNILQEEAGKQFDPYLSIQFIQAVQNGKIRFLINSRGDN